MAGHDGGFIFTEHDYYNRLGEASDMSVDSHQTSNGGSMYNSSVGSNNNSRTTMLMHHDLKTKTNTFAGHSVVHKSSMAHSLGEDALSSALLDGRFAAEGLEGYDEWTIDLRRLVMGPAFAQGAFGRLYRGTYNGEDVAVKILERPENNVERAMAMEQQFAQEVIMLANLKHENVVRFLGACRKPLVWCIVTEYAKGGSLRTTLSKKRAMPLRLAVRHALDIARGMEYLHSFGVIHRDLKSDNLLIADKSIKIADFGVARIEVQTEGMTPETGTYRWMAPEMIQHRAYNHKVDVYSFGIVLWELVTGNVPFQNMTAVQAAFAVVNRGRRPDIPQDCPAPLISIMTRCWDANPDERPSFSEVVQLLEEAQLTIMRSVGTARFRGCGCLTTPLTSD
ncbi:hypothetical protein GOP47_0016010 [Adiantum capillus-veneris]|uniref:non-specific serine/threonine protein kinase n=2 Tax=Adiantum capillus-veneris TaxID=13818 RepID=A0A9D4UKR7_ADICA|nr:hypothetical protein GOP47_0016010 [Adiantum capillus-veneris]